MLIPNYANLFKDPNITYPTLDNNTFANYIQQCKQLISATRLDLHHQAAKIIAANTPFELAPAQQTSTKTKYGALLIHGLLDSPFTMQNIGHELQTAGCLVKSILLPGHGTIPGALLNIDYQQWVETVKQAVTLLSKEVEQIFLVGFSTGGALAIYHSIHHPANIAGMILLAPALKINCPFDFAAGVPTSLSKHWPRLAWFHRDKYETLDYVKYRSTPFNAAYQVYRLAKELAELPQPSCPMFIALAASDTTVVSKISINYFLKQTNPRSRMIIYSKNLASTYHDKRIMVRTSSYPSLHIQDIGHISIPNAPDNPHYGKHGDYAEASHLESDETTLYGEYDAAPFFLQNFLYQYKIVPYQYQRLTFNPDFVFMSEQIRQWICKYSV